jgi:hypothetical protein
MSTEDDRYGPPTHSCEYCSLRFPAKWGYDVLGDLNGKLIVDISNNAAEVKSAIEHGCELFQPVSHRTFEQGERFLVWLEIDRETDLIPVGRTDPYLLARLVLRDERDYINPREQPEDRKELPFLVYLADGKDRYAFSRQFSYPT